MADKPYFPEDYWPNTYLYWPATYLYWPQITSSAAIAKVYGVYVKAEITHVIATLNRTFTSVSVVNPLKVASAFSHVNAAAKLEGN